MFVILRHLALVIYADGVDYTRRFIDEESFLADNDNFLLKRTNDSFVVAFKSGEY